MVFTKLGQHEKDAFFSLLDEYFASRPEIFANSQSSETQQQITEASTAAASAVRHAVVSNPETTKKLVSSGLRHFAGANPSTANRASSSAASASSSTANAGAGEPSEHETTSVAARVAAAQAMFSGKHNPFGKFGGANRDQTSSTSTTPSSPTPPSVPRINAPAIATLKQDSSSLAPPPVRRAPSARQQPPPPKEEWVEALYDYNSGEAGDLTIEEGQRVLLVERTSDDWWTGEVDGQKGLFPASYVKTI